MQKMKFMFFWGFWLILSLQKMKFMFFEFFNLGHTVRFILVKIVAKWAITFRKASLIDVSEWSIFRGWPWKVALWETTTKIIFVMLKERVVRTKFSALFDACTVHFIAICYVTLRTPWLTRRSLRYSRPRVAAWFSIYMMPGQIRRGRTSTPFTPSHLQC